MRILKSFIVFLSVFFLLCACTIKSDNQMTITEDGKMDYSVLIAFDNEVIECLNILESQGNNTDSVLSVDDIVNKSIKDSYLDGFNEEKYTDEDFVGNKYTYRVDNIDSTATNASSNTAAAPAAAAQTSSAASQIDLSDGLDMKELMSLLGSSQPQAQVQQKPQGLLSALFGKKPTQTAVPVEADNSINGTALLQALLANR